MIFKNVYSQCCFFTLKIIGLFLKAIPINATRLPYPSWLTLLLLDGMFGNNKLKKLEFLSEFYKKWGNFWYDKKLYVVDQKMARSAINKLEKGAEEYLESSPLKETFLGSSTKNPESRRAIASLFRKTAIEERAPLMVKTIKKMCWKIKQQSLESVNLTKWTLRLALDVVGNVLFEVDLEALDGKQDLLLDWMTTILHRSYALNEITPNSVEFIEANKKMDVLILEIFKMTLETGGKTEQKNLAVKLYEACGFEQAKENMKLIIMAGTETTASTIPVVFSLLTDFPEIQQELRDEITDRWSEIMEDPTKPLPKIESTLKEVLRLFPIAPFISRRTYSPVNIVGLSLDQNIDIAVFIWGIHRSNENWPDAKSFKPFRFLKEGTSHSGMYIPFGAGSRVCIGQHIACLELRLTIAILLHNFNFSKNHLTPELKFVVDWVHAVVHPDKDMKFILHDIK